MGCSSAAGPGTAGRRLWLGPGHVDARTGAVHWTGTLGASASLPPAVTDTTIFAPAGDGTLSTGTMTGLHAAGGLRPRRRTGSATRVTARPG